MHTTYATRPEGLAVQPLLFELAPIVQPQYGDKASIAERFAAFHEQNPHVYDALRDLALKMQARGVKRWGIGAAFEVLRFNALMQTNSLDYKLNNDYRSAYARLLMDSDARMVGFFETRKSQCD